jgi:uronate dehydrogenase
MMTEGQEPRTVLITGANGRLGSVLRSRLPELGWSVRSLVRADPAGPGDVVVGSVTDARVMAEACDGVDAVVHMGGIARPGEEWEAYLETNINGTRTVLEAARQQGVGRVALASSNHAVGYHRRGPADMPSDAQPRPDSFYGVSKAAVEALGSFYADEYGLQTTSLRIGSCVPVPENQRMLSSWLSQDDLVRLVQAALQGPWEEHLAVWGISRNTRRWWSLAAGERIGYFPQDDAEDYAEGLEPAPTDYVGGRTPPYA